MDSVYKFTFVEGRDLTEILEPFQMSVGNMIKRPLCGNFDSIIRSSGIPVPREMKVEMMTRTPGNAQGVFVEEAEFNLEREFLKSVFNRELVFKRVGFMGGVGRSQAGCEATPVDSD